MSQPGTVERYWTGVATQLQVEAGVFNRLVGHNGEMGRANEIALSQLLTRLLPATVDVGTGVVIDSSGGKSLQTDLIVFLRGTQPQILSQSTQLLFPIETVVATFEVKTKVDTDQIDDSGKKCASVRALKPTGDHPAPLTGLFAFEAAGSPSSRAAELNGLDPSERPDVACILTPGLVGVGGVDGLDMGHVPLHDVNSDGARVSRTWIAANDEQASVVRGGTTYPVSRFSLRGARYIFEPGRALLLFAEALLKGIALRAGTGGSWLSEYIPDVAREVVLPGSEQQ
jgi:hypothetical protein